MYWLNRLRHLYWYLHATTYMHFVPSPRLMIHSTRNLQPNTMLHWNWQIYTYLWNTRYTSNHSDNIRPCTHRQMCRSNRLRHLYWYFHATTYMHFVMTPRLLIHSTRNLQTYTMSHWNWRIYKIPWHTLYTSSLSDNIRPCTHRQMCRSNRYCHLYWYLHATTYMKLDCCPRGNNIQLRTERTFHLSNNTPHCMLC